MEVQCAVPPVAYAYGLVTGEEAQMLQDSIVKFATHCLSLR